MLPVRSLLDRSVRAFTECWRAYREHGSVDQFVDLALSLNNLTEQFRTLRLPGLVRLCEVLEDTVLSLLGDASTHPIGTQDASTMGLQINTLLRAIEAAHPRERADARVSGGVGDKTLPAAEWAQPREVWLISDSDHPWAVTVVEQFSVFGFRIVQMDWRTPVPQRASPLVMLFIPPAGGYGAAEIATIERIRPQHPASQLFCVAVPKSLMDTVALLRAGADVIIQIDQEVNTVLARVLDLIQSCEQEPFRVLVVEDSPTAVAVVQRALAQHGIENHSISGPAQLLDVLETYRPDLVLMDIHMPGCNGIEATRGLRQITAYQSVPVVFLSSEKDMRMQVDALRLGSDQFLTKPCNPVLLGAVVKTKIERYREMQRSSLHDGLTGLLNHSASQTRLAQLLLTLDPGHDHLCVAMLDLDHFKSVNDAYGHPLGDQLIRSLAWLLKGRLRGTDIIGRYGGEEFLVVLRGAGLDEGYAVLERIRRDFASMAHAHAGGLLHATFSAGLSSYPAARAGVELAKAADDALRVAKRSGRNRIERAPI